MKLESITNLFYVACLALIFSLFFDHSLTRVEAQYFNEPVSAATGGTGLAGIQSSTALFLNPSVIGLGPSFGMDLYYRNGSANPEIHENSVGITFFDNSSDVVVPGSLTYIKGQRRFGGTLEVDEQLIQANFARFLNPDFTMGMGVYRLSQDVKGAKNHVQWNGNFGVAWHWSPAWSLGLSYNNLVGQSTSIPEVLRLPPELGIGTRYNYKQVVEIRMDYSYLTDFNPAKRGEFGLGIETYAGQFVTVLVGGRWEESNGNRYFTTGIQFSGPKLKISYGLERNMDSPKAMAHSVDFQLPF